MAGIFVSFEGIEGSGKSTQVDLLRAALPEALFVREPGGTEVGEGVRRLVLHGPPMGPVTEMFLFMAARAELLQEVIQPALAAGRIVVADRYHDSTRAYQGGGRGLEVAWPPEFPKPDRTYLLAVTPEAGLGRAGAELDRLESEPLDFHRRVAAAYDRMASEEPQRFLRLDGTQPADELHRRVLGDIRALIEAPRRIRSSS